MTPLLGLWARIKGWAAAAAALLLALLFAFVKGRSEGRKLEGAKAAEAKRRALEDRLEMHREADAMEREVAGMTRAEKEEEARQWSKR